MQYCRGSGSYTVLIDLGLTELRNVRDSAAPRSYLAIDSRSRAFSDSRAWLRKARSYIEYSHGKNVCGICSLHHQNSGSRRVNMKIWDAVPSFNRNLSRHQLSCLLVLRLLSYASSRRRRKHGQNGKNIFGLFTFGALLLRFLVCCLVFTY